MSHSLLFCIKLQWQNIKCRKWTLALCCLWKPAQHLSSAGTCFELMTLTRSNSSVSVRPKHTMLRYILLFSITNIIMANVDIFVFKDYEKSRDLGGQPQDTFGGGLPPDITLLTSSSSSCSCNKLILSSLGPAATFQPHVMGVYTKVNYWRVTNCSINIRNALRWAQFHHDIAPWSYLIQDMDWLRRSGVLPAKLWSGLQALLAPLRLDGIKSWKTDEVFLVSGGRFTGCPNGVCAQPWPESRLCVRSAWWMALLQVANMTRNKKPPFYYK